MADVNTERKNLELYLKDKPLSVELLGALLDAASACASDLQDFHGEHWLSEVEDLIEETEYKLEQLLGEDVLEAVNWFGEEHVGEPVVV